MKVAENAYWDLLQLLVIHFIIFISADCVRITHLELSLEWSLVISPSTDIAANVRTFN